MTEMESLNSTKDKIKIKDKYPLKIEMVINFKNNKI